MDSLPTWLAMNGKSKVVDDNCQMGHRVIGSGSFVIDYSDVWGGEGLMIVPRRECPGLNHDYG